MIKLIIKVAVYNWVYLHRTKLNELSYAKKAINMIRRLTLKNLMRTLPNIDETVTLRKHSVSLLNILRDYSQIVANIKSSKTNVTSRD